MGGSSLLLTQAEELCSLHDHFTRVIVHLDFSRRTFSDRYPHHNMAEFAFESVGVSLSMYGIVSVPNRWINGVALLRHGQELVCLHTR